MGGWILLFGGQGAGTSQQGFVPHRLLLLLPKDRVYPALSALTNVKDGRAVAAQVYFPAGQAGQVFHIGAKAVGLYQSGGFLSEVK